jgi:hypothetical protein
MRELGQPPAQNRAHGDRVSGSAAWERPDGARFFWSLFFAGPKKSDPGPGRSAWRISASGAPGARRSATGPGEEGAEPPCLGIGDAQESLDTQGKPGSPGIIFRERRTIQNDKEIPFPNANHMKNYALVLV